MPLHEVETSCVVAKIYAIVAMVDVAVEAIIAVTLAIIVTLGLMIIVVITMNSH